MKMSTLKQKILMKKRVVVRLHQMLKTVYVDLLKNSRNKWKELKFMMIHALI